MISGVRVSAIKVQRSRISFAGGMKIWCSMLHEGISGVRVSDIKENNKKPASKNFKSHLNFLRNTYIHTYIHTYIIDHYNPSVRIIDLVSHTNYVVCVNFIYKWRDLQFKVDSERQIF